jgi:hypothetical protein
VTTVDNIWDHVLVESLVAVNLENYDKVPVIGKVFEKRDNEFTIHYWKGSWNKNGNHGFTVKDLGQMYFQKNVFTWPLLLLMKVTNFLRTQKGK